MISAGPADAGHVDNRLSRRLVLWQLFARQGRLAACATYNRSDQHLWVTVARGPDGIETDWGEVGPGSWRSWSSGPNPRGASYRLRGEWPALEPAIGVEHEHWLDTSFDQVPYTFIAWEGSAWWTRPCWRTWNRLDEAVVLTIRSHPGGQRLDVGSLAAHSYRDWFAGDYRPGRCYTLEATSLVDPRRVTSMGRAFFRGGWGEAVLDRDAQRRTAWRIDGDPLPGPGVPPPREVP